MPDVTYIEMDYVTWANLDADSVVVEVGTYEGAWAENVAKLYECTVHTFEPAIRAWGIAKKRLAEYENVHLYNLGLWDSDGVQALHDCQRDGATFCEARGYEHSAPVRSIVPYLRDTLKLETVDLLALNCEGSEFVLLPALIASGYISNIRQIMVQWHHIVACAVQRRKQILADMDKTHETFKTNTGAWQVWRRR